MSVARLQRDTLPGQVLPWNTVYSIMELRDQTKVPKHLHARSRQLIEEMAEYEFGQLVELYLNGGM